MKNRYVTLMARELQEHRTLWIAPAVVGALMIVAVLLGDSSGPGWNISPPPPGTSDNARLFGTMTFIGTMVVLGVVAAVAVIAYLLDCLFAERRDRSILFWKSLPVSDAETVLTKAFVALVAVPLGVLLLSAVLNLLLAAIAAVRFEALREVVGQTLVSGLPEAMLRGVLLWLFSALWYLPVAAYFMLASVLARRAPIVYAVLPPLVLTMWERLMGGEGHINRFVFERVVNGEAVNWILGAHRPLAAALGPFRDPALWLGVAVGAGMLYTVIRLRRYRDDT